MPNTTYPTALSITTLDDFSAEIWNLILGQNKVLNFVDKMGGVRRLSGGANITERVLYAENNTFGSISAYETIDTTPQEPFTAAQFAWKIIAGAYSLANLVVFQNSDSKHQISNVVTDLLMAAAQTGELELCRQYFADGTGNGGLDMGGLRHITAAGSWGTVGGINSASGADTWWRNQTASSVGSAAANLVDDLNTVRHSCERNGRMVDLWIGDQNAAEAYERACLQIKRNVFENKRAADVGLPNIEYAGAPFIHDPNQTAGYIDGICLKSTKLTLGTDMKYRKSPMVSPYDQDVKTQLLVLYGNVSCGDRSANGLLYGITYP